MQWANGSLMVIRQLIKWPFDAIGQYKGSLLAIGQLVQWTLYGRWIGLTSICDVMFHDYLINYCIECFEIIFLIDHKDRVKTHFSRP